MAVRGTTDLEETRALNDTEASGDAPVGPEPRRSLDELARPGSLLGRYAVLEEIGRGGMGLVLRAYDPKLHREIALKVVQAVSAEAEARLVREARAMAQLSHPNVVAIYDVVDGDSLVAGAGRTSQVVLAMEYVAGVTFGQWCRAQSRSPDEIVDLAVQAGRGLAAAHREGLLHRDFKPDNVLVGDDGRVRVTDFGLARPAADTASRDTMSRETSSRDSEDSEPGFDLRYEDSQLTRAGTVLGSPRYMAPEQHRVGPLSPAADQFAFCVTLWEALQGEPPYVGKMEALLRAKLEGPPSWSRGPKVSSRIVEAIRRGLNPTPTQRFETMDELLAVLARARRSLGRWAAAGVLAAGGLATVGWASRVDSSSASLCSGAEQQLDGVWDASQRDRVHRAFVDGGVAFAPTVWGRIAPRIDGWVDTWTTMHTDACEATQVRHEQSEAVMDLRMACLHRARLRLEAASSVLQTATPTAVENAHDVVGALPDLQRCADVEALQAEVPPPGPDEALAVASIRGSLAEAAARGEAGDYGGAFAAVTAAQQASAVVAYAAVQTEVDLELGSALEALGRFDEAEAALRRARLSAATLGQHDLLRQATLKLIYVLGYRMARPAEAMAMREVALGLSGDDAKTEASARSILALVLARQGHYDKAEAEHRAVLALRAEALGEQHPDYASSRNNLGNVLYSRGEYEAAETEYRAALTMRSAALGPDHPDVAASRNNLGLVLAAQGRYPEAETEHRTAMADRIAALGADHPDVASSHNNLAMVLQLKGDLGAAEAEYRLAQTGWSDALGPDHPHVASVRHNLATVLSLTGRHAEAETEERAVLAGRIQALGAEHPDVAATRHNLAIFLRTQGRLAEAEAEFRGVVEMRIEVLGADHPEVGSSLNNLGNVLHEQGRLEEAEAMHRKSLALRLRALDAEHPDVASSRQNLATVLEDAGKAPEALAEFEQALKLRRASLPADHPAVAESALAVAGLVLDLGRRTEALALYREALSIFRATDEPADTALAAFGLAKALATESTGYAEARSVAREAVEAFRDAEDDEGRAEVQAWLEATGA